MMEVMPHMCYLYRCRACWAQGKAAEAQEAIQDLLMQAQKPYMADYEAEDHAGLVGCGVNLRDTMPVTQQGVTPT